ncbi:hypothetical protein BD560DRAFT_412341 [Blakeslea trispora]|nr:hypothetical protein BD560DRAFT_412341 [Blakeslea trispora]
MDPVSVLSDAELQKELAIFADAQFTYDVAPGVAAKENTNNKRKSHHQPDMHSLLNVKLASLSENSYHTAMSPDAIAKFYDNSPDCSPPNGYHSANPSPPNGFYSPNPTPPNGVHLSSNPSNTSTYFQDILNPPITFYEDDALDVQDDDQFLKTMSILTSYSEPAILETQDASAAPLDKEPKKRSHVRSKKPSQLNKEDIFKSMDEETTSTTGKKSQQGNISNSHAPLSKEDKRRRNTAASARFRVKKKLREQALQQTADEMTERAKAFENRVHELEREVKWLKELIIERKDGRLEQLLMQQFAQKYHSSNNNSKYH